MSGLCSPVKALSVRQTTCRASFAMALIWHIRFQCARGARYPSEFPSQKTYWFIFLLVNTLQTVFSDLSAIDLKGTVLNYYKESTWERISPMAEGTLFAPAERSEPGDLEEQIRFVGESPLVSGLLNTVCGLLAVLNDKRQIVSLNDSFMKLLGIDDPVSVLGSRPGEALHCVHCSEEPGGCVLFNMRRRPGHRGSPGRSRSRGKALLTHNKPERQRGRFRLPCESEAHSDTGRAFRDDLPAGCVIQPEDGRSGTDLLPRCEQHALPSSPGG